MGDFRKDILCIVYFVYWTGYGNQGEETINAVFTK